MKSSNPVLARVFDQPGQYLTGDRMSVGGTVNKTGLLLVIASAVAAYPWSLLTEARTAELNGLLWGGMIAGFILAVIISFKPTWAPIGAPLYAAAEGLVLGGISAIMNAAYPGIALQAIAGTFGTLGVMLLLYKTGVMRATQQFRTGVIAATGGVMAIYLLSMALHWFGVSLPFVYGNGLTGILFSVVVAGIAALNLILDFDLIEQGAKAGAPKYMEWVGAFGLMVTMVWLYLEMLRLFSKIRGRN
ncbi:MAG: Bax inhibitor-1/YccA family protein [Myxococcota bacterium]